MQVEMDLVRPPRGNEEMGQWCRADPAVYSSCKTFETWLKSLILGNFMLSLELRSSRNPLLAVMASAQPVRPSHLTSDFLLTTS